MYSTGRAPTNCNEVSSTLPLGNCGAIAASETINRASSCSGGRERTMISRGQRFITEARLSDSFSSRVGSVRDTSGDGGDARTEPSADDSDGAGIDAGAGRGAGADAGMAKLR